MAVDGISTQDSVNVIKDIYRNLDRNKVAPQGDRSFKEILAATETGRSERPRSIEDRVELGPRVIAKIPEEANGAIEGRRGPEEILVFAKQAVESASDVRTNLVNRIKSQIDRGEYNVSPTRVADSLISSHVFDDLI